MVNPVPFSKIGNHACKQPGTPILVPDHLAPAAEPYPFALYIPGPVFNVVVILPAIRYILVAFQKIRLVMGMD